jgi:hypothetical protein
MKVCAAALRFIALSLAIPSFILLLPSTGTGTNQEEQKISVEDQKIIEDAKATYEQFVAAVEAGDADRAIRLCDESKLCEILYTVLTPICESMEVKAGTSYKGLTQKISFETARVFQRPRMVEFIGKVHVLDNQGVERRLVPFSLTVSQLRQEGWRITSYDCRD